MNSAVDWSTRSHDLPHRLEAQIRQRTPAYGSGMLAVMRFEWDEAKNDSNVRKHGIDFTDAPEVFEYPMLTWLDTQSNYGEDRWCAIGMTGGHVVKLVFTERGDGEIMRVISLRKANKHERQRYQEVLSH